MLDPKLTANIRNYLPLFAMMVVVVLGIFIARDLNQTSTDWQYGTAVQFLDEQTGSGADRRCISPEIYTSLPAKCKTADGNFIELGGMGPNVFVVPESR